MMQIFSSKVHIKLFCFNSTLTNYDIECYQTCVIRMHFIAIYDECTSNWLLVSGHLLAQSFHILFISGKELVKIFI